MKRTLIAILAAFGLAATGPPLEMPPVSCNEQFALTVKILTFDRNLSTRVGDEIVFGILYQENEPVSLRVKTEMESAIASRSGVRVGKIPIRSATITVDQSSTWEQEMKSAGVDIAYLAPMRNPVLVRVIQLCRDLKMTTVGSLPDYPSLGTAIGFARTGDHSDILINLKAAREAGADFNSRLLAMVKVSQ